MDRLRSLVREYDRRRNTPRQMDVTTRSTETKHICIVCRKVYEAYDRAGPCPNLECGGQLIEVTW